MVSAATNHGYQMSDIASLDRHFSSVSTQYRDLRTTDVEPIQYIAERLGSLSDVRALDVGCGAGRYDALLLQHRSDMGLICMDFNFQMLAQARRFLRTNGFSGFHTLRGSANEIPLARGSRNCIVSFNAVHHFRILHFLRSAAEVLEPGGTAFIYTRLRGQNAGNIWGRLFPGFTEKETRLMESGDMERLAVSVPGLRLENATSFCFERRKSLPVLVSQARARHYSTFCLYTDEEFEAAVNEFQQRVTNNFADTEKVSWSDENILFELRRG